MDVFDVAMQREKDSENYYRSLAEDCSDKGLKAILTRLADAEVKHFSIVQAMRDNADVADPADPLAADVRPLFTEIRDRGPAFDDSMAQVDLYKKAQGFEQESLEYYRSKADEVDSPQVRQVLLTLAGQEKMHYQILGTIIQMVSRPQPGNWLEDAEWFHLDEY